MNKSILGGIAFTLLFISCTQKKDSMDYTPVVKLSKAEGVNRYYQQFAGIVRSDEIANLAFRVSGMITQLDIQPGEKVKKGQLIAILDTRDFGIQLSTNKANYDVAAAQLERSKRLYAQQAISKQEFEIKQTNYEQAKSAYENAQNSLLDTRLHAPFTGTIERKMANNYQRVQAGETVVKLVNSNQYLVWFTVADDKMIDVKGNPSISVVFSRFKDIAFKAKIKEVFDISPEGAGIPVSVEITDPAFDMIKDQIKPGFSCNVNLEIVRDNNTTVKVPISSIFQEVNQKQDKVWVYDPKSETVSARNVTIGNLFGSSEMLIASGLSHDEQVVTAGVYKLKEGQKVKIYKGI